MGPFEDPALFVSSGRETLDLARDLMGLLPSHRLLDLGCGCGRVAVPAMAFLDDSGSYAGLDIDPDCIEWCRENIEARDGRFSFTYLDVQSESYNPHGSISPDRAVLPFRDGDFDRALVSSVFTHLTESGIARYISELRRVLRPGGLLLASLLLMNGAAESAVGAGTTSFEFRHALGEHSWTLDPSDPLDGVAVAEAWFRSLAGESGFRLDQTVYGTWRGTVGWAVQHDWVVLRSDLASSSDAH
jgi:SAM-dependent methyltransferase